MNNAIIIGAGVGGLTAAATLAREGWEVTVLEAHVYPGGCAGTFYYQGYRFDAGATLAGGFSPEGPMAELGRLLAIRWPISAESPAMRVHLPDGSKIDRLSGEARWEERERAFGPQSEDFWRWQETTAEAMWSLATLKPAWPPQSVPQAWALAGIGLKWLRNGDLLRKSPGLMADAFRTVDAHLRNAPDRLRWFVDGQLQISAQTTSEHANALYGAAALDLPRRGVVAVEGGMGGIAEALVGAVRNHGGQVLYRQEVTRVRRLPDGSWKVRSRRGDDFVAGTVLLNLPPSNAARLLGPDAPPSLREHGQRYPSDGWGAFVTYLGLDGAVVPARFPLHHQIIAGRPFGEGNSIFLSLSPDWDLDRSPLRKRAATLSTHTTLDAWWELHELDPKAYEARKQRYLDRTLELADRALPGLREAAELVLPGTPVTFERFTRRSGGWVGGYPQTSLLRTRGPWLGDGLWLVGDSIFPGQSVTAVALGGMRVAELIHDRVRDSRSRKGQFRRPAESTLKPGYIRIKENYQHDRHR